MRAKCYARAGCNYFFLFSNCKKKNNNLIESEQRWGPQSTQIKARRKLITNNLRIKRGKIVRIYNPLLGWKKKRVGIICYPGGQRGCCMGKGKLKFTTTAANEARPISRNGPFFLALHRHYTPRTGRHLTKIRKGIKKNPSAVAG